MVRVVAELVLLGALVVCLFLWLWTLELCCETVVGVLRLADEGLLSVRCFCLVACLVTLSWRLI